MDVKNFYKLYENRLDSFKTSTWIATCDWIRNSEDFAKAGFYYIGYKDYVKCFECNGGLCKWNFRDDPWIEHTKYYPNCNFIIENKSELFIKICIELLKIENENRKVISNFELLLSRVKDYKINSINDNLLCKICYEHEINCLLLPCAHQLSCVNCTNKLNKCPICKSIINIKQKVYLC